MARSKNQAPAEEWLNLLLEGDWKVSATSCVVILLLGYVFIPALFTSSPFTKAFIPLLQTITNFGAGLSAIISIVKLAIAWVNAPLYEDDFDLFDENMHEKTSNQYETDIKPQTKQRFKTVPNNYANMDKPSPITPQFSRGKWSVSFLQSLDWKVFETLCSEYFSAKDIPNKETSIGADGGIDLKLFVKDSNQPFAIAQCKQWSRPVDIKPLRELLGVMAHEGIDRGFFIASSSFYEPAQDFAKANRIKLINGQDLVKGLNALDIKDQQRIFYKITQGDFTTPTCASCGIKMVMREGKTKLFWGCKNYPKCRNTLTVKKT